MHSFCFLLLSFGSIASLNAAEGNLAQPTNSVVLVPGILFSETNPEQTREQQRKYWGHLLESMKLNGGGCQYLVEVHGNDVSVELIHQSDQGANIYTVVFSPEASLDGLAYRSIELNQALHEICRIESAPITIVGHSAGGLLARIILQEAIPGIKQPMQVDHLVTIATPHHGAAMADNFAKLVGARAESLMTTSPLIQRINSLPLPKNVHFTSIIVNSFGLEGGKPGNAYVLPFDSEIQTTVPRQFLFGGDEVVHSISQNLAFTESGAIRQRETSDAVRSLVVRCPLRKADAGLLSGLVSTQTLHSNVLCLDDFCTLVSRVSLGQLSPREFKEYEAKCVVQSTIESQIKGRNPLSEVVDVRINSIDLKEQSIDYDVTAKWKRFTTQEEVITGTIDVTTHPVLNTFVVQ